MSNKSAAVVVTVVVAAVAAALGYWYGNYRASMAEAKMAAAAAPAAAADAGRKVLYWYDPMVPGQHFDKPGKSPFMDMELVPKYADESDTGGVAVSGRQQQSLGVVLAKVETRTLTPKLTAYGTVQTDESTIEAFNAPAAAQVQKLYVSAQGSFVKAGAPLVDLWIPQWASAQTEYLQVRALGDAALTRSARQRLELLFMPADVIGQVEKSGKPVSHVTLRAPQDGFVQTLFVRAGAQVGAGAPLLQLSTLSKVWLVASYAQSQAAQVQSGAAVRAEIPGMPGHWVKGTVMEVLPTLDTATRTLQARIALENPEGMLKPGMYVAVDLEKPEALTNVLAVPAASLITVGSQTHVIVQEGQGHFKPVAVTRGAQADGWVQILSGLKTGEEIVASGQFLIDSEASLTNIAMDMSGTMAMGGEAVGAPKKGQYETQGVIKAFENGSATIAHEPVPALKWGKMTMDFEVPQALQSLAKPGAKIDFTFDVSEDGVKIVTITPMKVGAYHTTGLVKAFSNGAATIAHEPVPALKWGKMTMDFDVPDNLRSVFTPGTQVDFTFDVSEDGVKIVTAQPVSTQGGQQ